MSTVFKVLTRPWAWFRSSPQTDYEEVLSSLSAQIDHVQTNLVSIQLRRRRATIILPLWASLFWAIYTVAAYFAGLLGSRRLDEEGNTLLVWGPILLAPLVIFFTRRIVRWWYKRVQVAEDEHLKELKRQRNVKIEEIKRATRYDHLRMLLDKYDEDGARKAPGTTAPVGAGRTPNTKQQQQQQGSPQPRTPVKGQAATQPNTPQQRSMPGAHATPVLRADGTPVPPTASAGAVNGAPAIIRPPLPSAMPTQRTWLDRVADAVLGSDPSSAVLGPEQKYALICSKCKTHNGLATREEFEEVRECRARVEKAWESERTIADHRLLSQNTSAHTAEHSIPVDHLQSPSRLRGRQTAPHRSLHRAYHGSRKILHHHYALRVD